jgi:hypothetical protein
MKNIIINTKNKLKATRLNKARRLLLNYFQKPIITQQWFPPALSKYNRTLLICVESNFDQNVMNANYLMRLGFAQGWTEVAGGVKFIYVKDLFREVDQYDNPAIFISQHNLRHFTFQEVRKLRGKNVFVWVHVHPRANGKFEKANPLISTDVSDLYLDSYSKLICVEPKFVWNCIGNAGMEYYNGWKEDGFKWESIFPAANTKIYFPEYSNIYKDIKISYVGGYWEEKAQAFDNYLRPFENVFVPYGYDVWPYRLYGGELNMNQERHLYSSAGLIPLVTSPAGWQLAEITERYLKAPACKAFCIADQNPALRELYTENEMLQSNSAEHFQYLVNEYISGKIDVEHWRKTGYQAVLDKHLAKYRALQIIQSLDY